MTLLVDSLPLSFMVLPYLFYALSCPVPYDTFIWEVSLYMHRHRHKYYNSSRDIVCPATLISTGC